MQSEDQQSEDHEVIGGSWTDSAAGTSGGNPVDPEGIGRQEPQ